MVLLVTLVCFDAGHDSSVLSSGSRGSGSHSSSASRHLAFNSSQDAKMDILSVLNEVEGSDIKFGVNPGSVSHAVPKEVVC